MSDIIKKLDIFFSEYPKVSFRKGDILIQADSKPTGIFYVEEGIIRRYWIFANGTEVTLNLYKPHTFLPMSWAIGEVSNKHIYEALTPITARKAPRDDVLEFLHNEPDIVFDLLRRVYVGMEGLWTHMESLTAGNAYTKLVASLIILAKRFGKPAEKNNAIIVQLKLGEKDIANYAGMSRETASRELQKLKKQHFVDFENGRISIQNLKALEEELNI